jgi:uncharacterized Zn-finger protein
MFTETSLSPTWGSGLAGPLPITTVSVEVRGRGYPKFRNDRSVTEISIGVTEFECIGESPPQDHPHIYINMGQTDTILCPYCGTRSRFSSRLTPLDADARPVFLLTQRRLTGAAAPDRSNRLTRCGLIITDRDNGTFSVERAAQ